VTRHHYQVGVYFSGIITECLRKVALLEGGSYAYAAAGPDFDRGYSEGRNLTLDEAVALALDSIRQRATSPVSG